MKQLKVLHKAVAFMLASISVGLSVKGQNVGIGTSAPHPSAILDLSSTSRGLLLPRLSIYQRNAIPTPVAGLLIWNNTSNQLQVYQGQNWAAVALSPADPGLITTPPCQGTNTVWAAENLNVTAFNDGTPIPHLTGAAWDNATGPAWRHVNDNPANDAIFGKLYNGYCIEGLNGIRLPPAGYRVPTRNDIENLFCNGLLPIESIVETGTQGWNATANIGATNATGLSIRAAGGYYYGPGPSEYIGFKEIANMYINEIGLTTDNQPSVTVWSVARGTSGVWGWSISGNGLLRSGYTVRCILNEF